MRDRTMGADSSTGRGDGEGSGGSVSKLLGEPKLPPKLVRALFLLLSRACCSCCLTRTSRFVISGYALESRVKSKRIALDADGAVIIRSNQFGCCLSKQFYCSRPGRGASPNGNSSPKESVSCASAVLFLLCWSRCVLFLLWGYYGFYCCCARDKAVAVPTLWNPFKSITYAKQGMAMRYKKAGFPLPTHPAFVTRGFCGNSLGNS